MLESFAVFGCDFSGVNIGRKLFDTLVRFLDVSAKLCTWCQRGIAEPVMANHAFLIGIGDRSRFELFHRSERLLIRGCIFPKKSSGNLIRLISMEKTRSPLFKKYFLKRCQNDV